MRSPRILPLILLVLPVMACVSRPAPVVHPALREAAEKPTVIFVPGITGTTLVDRKETTVWGDFRSLVAMHDGGYSTAVPLGGAADDVVAGEAILSIDFLRPLKPIYVSVRDLFAANGFRTGSLRDGGREGEFLFFPYDWRRDSIGIAAELAAQLEQLSEKGSEKTPIVLICQSGGAHICRWVAKYGSASLEEAERGERRSPRGVSIEKIILVGTSNGGAIRILREMNRGRQYVKFVGRRFHPEVFFTFDSLFQDLPVYRGDLFVDAEASATAVDLFDAENWRKYGWSIFAAEASARAERHPAIFGTPDAWMQRAQSQLLRARRLHASLQRQVTGYVAPPIYSIQNLYDPTPERALLRRAADGRWLTELTGDRFVDRDPLRREAVTEPGDGHATLGSQLFLSAQEKLAEPPIYIEGGHFEIVTSPATHKAILEIIAGR